ncbi:hypothetical protein KZX37_08330 [Microbacterium sp. EYE_5]|uniref:hypothetical protein n=1 Tax=unclassified Microbacterium TaxID=2609290 RepID=UPI002004EFB7|nr:MULTISPECIES: hypothetical protein [unclassified Microbacterium]MCK6081479.1 hypothetical protein [Microbacterium sp. EYE_382]MCK6086749.1 hypothetical protein [Microbacterium sp. EYE_384]MCK6123753.1 hypothetical protein [Microbacterium sp. EYE_80]MCK6126662.1 hypothetical protein [Microbacterium sp. EYE_79]MCK6142434.1 hypothetical protein [Microbacterium sp. EYE_39]
MAPNLPGIDPLTLALLSIFGGAALTAGAGLLGAWLQGRKEHNRWVRERRFEAYVAYSQADDSYNLVRKKLDRLGEAKTDIEEWLRLRAQSPGAAGEAPTGLRELGTTVERQLEAFQELEARLEAAHAVTIHAIAPFTILGPESVIDKARAVVTADVKGRQAAVFALEAEMSRTLGIKRKRRR